jgi:hypothetical protein
VKIYRFAYDRKKQDRKIVHYFHKEYYSFPRLYIRNLELVQSMKNYRYGSNRMVGEGIHPYVPGWAAGKESDVP